MKQDSSRSSSVNQPVGLEHSRARRRFLVECGKYAVVTPPVVTLLLSVSQSRYATAASGGNPQSGVASQQSGSGGFSFPSDGICSETQSGPFVGDAPGCARLRSRVEFPH